MESNQNYQHAEILLEGIFSMLSFEKHMVFDPINQFLDVKIVCKDGVFYWSRLLMAACSPFLQAVLNIDDDIDINLILPDLDISCVYSLFRSLVDPKVRDSFLTAKHLQLAILLGFTSHSSCPSNDQSQCNPLPDSDVGTVSSRNNSIRPLICKNKNCGLTFQRRRHLIRHEASHDQKDDKVCEICGKIFHHEDNLKLHLQYHEDTLKSFPCPNCGKSFQGRRALLLHKATLHAEKVTCQFCSRMMTKRLLQRHLLRKHHNEMKQTDVNIFECTSCQRCFSSAQSLTVHRRTHDELIGSADPKVSELRNLTQENNIDGQMSSKGAIPNLMECDTCHKTFSTRYRLRLHQRRSHQRRQVPCPECGKSVKDLLQHERLMHTKSAKIIQSALENKLVDFPVDLSESDCCKESKSKTEVKAGPKTSSSVTKFDCNVCGKFYQNRRGLARHLREVHAENRFECPLCGHFFPVRHSLERHIRNVHHPVKHECQICGLAVLHLAVHLASAHCVEPAAAKEMAEERTGRSAARTDLTLDCVLQQRRHRQQLLATSSKI